MSAPSSAQALAAAYDALAETYAAGRERFDTGPQLDALAALVPAPARVLDAGCGAGRPVAARFAARGDTVTGIDLSAAMLALARRAVPQARFVQLDMRTLARAGDSFPDESFDAVCAVYSVFHLPRAEHAALFGGFARVLAPGGALLMTLATREYTGADTFDGTMEFIGRRLPYSHDTREEALCKLDAAGFAVEDASLVATGGETFCWVIARKRG